MSDTALPRRNPASITPSIAAALVVLVLCWVFAFPNEALPQSAGTVMAPPGTEFPLARFQSLVVTVVRLPAGTSNESPIDPLTDWLEERPHALLPAAIGGGLITGNIENRKLRILTVSSLLGDSISASAKDGSTLVKFSYGRSLPANILSRDPISQLAVLEVTIPEHWDEIPGTEEFPVTTASSPSTADSRRWGFLFSDPVALARSGSSAIAPGFVRREGWRQEGDLSRKTSPGVAPATFPRWWIDRLPEPAITGAVFFRQQDSGLVLPPSQGSYSGTGLEVIPLSGPMERIVDDLLAGYEPEYGFVGVELTPVSLDDVPEIPPDERSIWKEGLRIDSLPENLPTEGDSLRIGDLILSLREATRNPAEANFNENKPLFSPASMIQLPLRPDAFSGRIQFFAPGDRVELLIWNQTSRTIQTTVVRVGKLPVMESPERVVTAQRVPLWRGMRVGFASPEWVTIGTNSRWRFFPGVLVTEVIPDSPAGKAGIRVGDHIEKVGEREIHSPDEFQQAVNDWPGTVPTRITERPTEVMIEGE